MELPYDPTIPPLGIHRKKTKTLTQKDIRTPNVIGAKIWERPRCPSMDEWIKKCDTCLLHRTYFTNTGRGKQRFTVVCMENNTMTINNNTRIKIHIMEYYSATKKYRHLHQHGWTLRALG